MGGAQLDARAENGTTVFLLACAKGHMECMEVLKDAGCDLTVKLNNGSTGLIHAAAGGRAAALQWLVDTGGAQLDARAEQGGTAFLFACHHRQVECMRVLKEAGCDLTVKLNDGSTCLMQAAWSWRRGLSRAARLSWSPAPRDTWSAWRC